jgi:elongation factor 1-delta
MKGEFLLRESVFLNRSLYTEAERHYSLRNEYSASSITNEVTKIRNQLKTHMEDSNETVKVSELLDRLHNVEAENKTLKSLLERLEGRLSTLEKASGVKPPVAAAAAPAKPAAVPAKPAAKKDEDFDLFDSDEEDTEEKKRITEERLKQYADKKQGKKEIIAKSSILLDVKVWDDETDMKALEAEVRKISIDGLVWGQSKLVPVAYGVKKLQIGCVIEDDKVSTEALEEQICSFEEYVQSVDIAAFNKI